MKTLSTLAACILLCSALARGQASVNESQETAQLWVDAVNGSDSNPGTKQKPLKTIGAAATIAVKSERHGVGTLVTVNPGTYRESISFGSSPQDTTLPITFEAATNGTAIISGADVWTGWQAYSGNAQIYTNSWPYKWGLCPASPSGPLEEDIVRRREMIVVNGVVLTQVLSLNEVQVGTFFVDETGGTVYVWPPLGTDISTATVEVATRSGLFNDAGLGDLVIRGLTFQYDNSCRDNVAVNFYNSASNLLVDTDTFAWNNSDGVTLAGTTYTTIQNSVANHNGDSGMHAVKVKYGLWQNNQTSYNNWRGAQGDYAWDAAGMHFYQDHQGTVTGDTAIYNQTHGVHWDTDNANFTATSILSSENLRSTLLFEKNEGPIMVSGSNFCNGNPPVGSNVIAAVSVNNSEYVTLSGNSIYNVGNQVAIQGVAGGYSVTNWETGQTYNLVTQNLTLMQNVIEGVGATECVFNDGLGGSDWTKFASTLISDYNTWWNAASTKAWAIPSAPLPTYLDFKGWQDTTSNDAHSQFQAPSMDPSVACQVTPDAPDYWIAPSAPSLTVRPGTPAVFTATVTPVGDFGGVVNLSDDGVENIPGATASWSANTLPSSGASTFTVDTTNTTPAGTYPVVLMATSDSVTRAVTVSVIVDTSVNLSTNSLNFPNTDVGMSSPVQKVTLTNKGTTSLSISGIDVNFPDGNDFSQTNTCGSSLGMGERCTISVTFSPKFSGLRSTTLAINDSDPTSPQNISLSGTGTAPVATVSPSSLTFGNQIVKTTSAAKTVTLTNTGTAALAVDSINIWGNYAETSSCGTTLAVGASCTISVTFTPTETGTRSGGFNIHTNAQPSTSSVTLTGTGVAPTVTISPARLAFPSQRVDTTSPPKTVTLTNTSTVSLTINSIRITAPFAETNHCGASLSGGKSCTISVTFTPLGTGTHSGSLTVSDNAGSKGSATQKVTLSGTGSS